MAASVGAAYPRHPRVDRPSRVFPRGSAQGSERHGRFLNRGRDQPVAPPSAIVVLRRNQPGCVAVGHLRRRLYLVQRDQDTRSAVDRIFLLYGELISEPERNPSADGALMPPP